MTSLLPAISRGSQPDLTPGLAGRSGSLTASRGGPAGGSGAAAAPASPRGANPSHVADAMKALTQQLYSLLQERQRYNNDAAAELAPAGARAAVALPAGASSVPKSWLRADGTEERGGAGSEEPQPQRSMLPVLASRKEELGLLQRWLEEQLQQVLGVQAAAASSSARGTADASSTPASAELADAAVRLFSVAAEELRRQVSSESRERGEMLGAVTDALCSAVAAQVGLAAEHRLAAVQQQYAAAVAAATAATKSAEAAKRAQSGSAEEGGAGPGAALKLSQAVWTAEELTQKLRMTDLTLQGEVTRRQEAERQLDRAQLLLARTEHEWLRHRATNKAMEEQMGDSKLSVDKMRQAMETAQQEAAEAKHAMMEMAASQAPRDAAVASMRREFASSEILLVSLQQQVKDLETQLQQSKGLTRQQALMLMDANQEIERLRAEVAGLERDLAESQEGRAKAETGLEQTSEKLQVVEEKLAATAVELAETAAARATEAAVAATTLEKANAEVKAMKTKMEETSDRQQVADARCTALDEELEAVREAMMVVAQALDGQGIDAPLAGDRSWEVLGALGALQRCIPLCGQQLESLYGQRETIKAEHAQLADRLKIELMTQQRLQQELYQSKTDEASLLRAKEEVTMKLETAEMLRRSLERDKRWLNDTLDDAKKRIQALEESADKLQKQVEWLMPFESQYLAAATQVQDLTEERDSLSSAYNTAKEDIAQLLQSQVAAKDEIERLLKANHNLSEQCKQIAVLVSDMDEVNATKDKAIADAEASRRKMEDAVRAAAAALQQLELSKFLLQSDGQIDQEQVKGLLAAAANAASAAVSAGGGVPGAGSRPGTASATTTQARMLERERMLGSLLSAHETAQRLEVHGEAPQSPARRTQAAAAAAAATAAATAAGRAKSPSVGTRSRVGSATTRAPGEAPEEGEDMQYGVLLPPEVLSMMNEQGFGQYVEDKKLRWLNIKLKFMAAFSKRLRERLKDEAEKREELEVELLKREADMLEEARAREEYLATELVPSIRALISRVQHESSRDLAEVRSAVPILSGLLSKLASTDASLGLALMALRKRLSDKQDTSTMTDDSLEPQWAQFARALPREPGDQPIATPALVDTIVRIYMAQVNGLEVLPVWGPARHDTVWDAIMTHYTCRTSPNTFDAMQLQGHDSAAGRLIRSAIAAQDGSPKAAMFCYFLGVSFDAICWTQQAWHFFLHVLYSLKLLLGGRWRDTMKHWSTPHGALIPVQAAMDVVGNLFNVQEPQDLEGAVSGRLSGLVIPSQAGPTLDLDAFLLMLVSEYNMGNCPRNPLLYPRRLTDGTLFNIFNAAGNSEFVEGIPSARAHALISPSNPSSPVTSRPPHSGATTAASAAASPVVHRLAIASSPAPSGSPAAQQDRQAGTPTAASQRSPSARGGAAGSRPSSGLLQHRGSSGGGSVTSEGAAGIGKWQVQLPALAPESLPSSRAATLSRQGSNQGSPLGSMKRL